MPIITISRQMCSFGDEVAQALSRKLNWELITRNDLFYHFPNIASNQYDMTMLTASAKYYLKQDSKGETYLDRLTQELLEYSRNNSAVLVGFGAQMIFTDRENALNVRIITPKNVRMTRVKKQFHVSDEEAEQILDKADKKHKKFVTTVFNSDLSNTELYHLILNTATLSVDDCVAAIIAIYKARELANQIGLQIKNTEIINNLSERPELKNQSEEEFAKILDKYQIDWQYEPKTFPMEWDAEGNVTMAFSPDFYLTKFDTYIELTTMDQKYITKKNKKVKKLCELYPGTNIKIVYKKDFNSLIERFQ